MAYWENAPYMASAGNPRDHVFRVVGDCKDFKDRKPDRRAIKPLVKERLPDRTEISGFFCDDWPLGNQHACIPDNLKKRFGMLSFNRQAAIDSGIPCDDDEQDYPNHVCITLPRYYNDEGLVNTEYEVVRDELLAHMRILWSDCDPTVVEDPKLSGNANP